MKSTQDDLVDLFDFVWNRLEGRMHGLTDVEWSWCPTSDERISLRWRLGHIANFLTESRNWQWLGSVRPGEVKKDESSTSAAALAALTESFAAWRALLADPDVDLAVPIGAPAGRYGQATRRSFVLHIADELIHHSAEAALLRDLYAGVLRSSAE
jgi:hypothetical protein